MLDLLCNADINIFTQRLKYLNILDIQKPDQTRSLLPVLYILPWIFLLRYHDYAHLSSDILC